MTAGQKRAMGLLFVFCIVLLYAGISTSQRLDEQADNQRESQVESCERGNDSRIDQWLDDTVDAEDAYYLWGQESDPEVRPRYKRIYRRHDRQARNLVDRVQKNPAAVPGLPTLDCEEAVQ